MAERDENTCRKDLLPTEAVALGAAIEAVESKAAKQRQAATRKRGTAELARVGKLPTREKGRASEKVAAAVGMKARTYEKEV